MLPGLNKSANAGTRPNSKLVGVVLLYFCNQLDCFVHCFQSPGCRFKRRSYTPKGYFNSRKVSLSGLHQHEEVFDVSGANPLIDEKESISPKDIDPVQKSSESEYCYVNLDDVSVPFCSREDSESTFIAYTDDGLCLPAGPIGQLKESIANFLNEPSVEISIALVVLLNSFLVALSTMDSLSYLLPYFRSAEIVIGSIFFADFLARWFSSSRDQFGFILDPQFALDILVVILPLVVISPFVRIESTFLPSALLQPSGLFNLQLLRVLRLQRFLRDLDTFKRFAEQTVGRTNLKTTVVLDWQLQLARVVLSLFTLISVATGLIYTAEHTVNPNINNYFDALYFGLTTLTTVGFGDVSPVTSQGRLIVCGSIVFGVAVVPAQSAALLEALLDRENIRNGRPTNSARKAMASIDSTKSSITNPAKSSVLALDTELTCSRCGTSFHWSCARYCYNCGTEIEESP